jgi:hypothetical protein
MKNTNNTQKATEVITALPSYHHKLIDHITNQPQPLESELINAITALAESHKVEQECNESHAQFIVKFGLGEKFQSFLSTEYKKVS